MRTLELIGAALDWAVSKCEGIGEVDKFGGVWVLMPNEPHFNEAYTPSTNWAQGGPIIDELIKGHLFLMEDGDGDGEHTCHVAYSSTPHDNSHGFGKTPLIAAMRCYVASKLGAEVDVPKELL